ncbi:hypothetical protein BRAS3843_860036 [Bradyrhizobium sp. STM 3843]|nr:hypothetical protein BRAS3843_860036 [Bradyrhizobium sp. STM 3843]
MLLITQHSEVKSLRLGSMIDLVNVALEMVGTAHTTSVLRWAAPSAAADFSSLSLH